MKKKSAVLCFGLCALLLLAACEKKEPAPAETPIPSETLPVETPAEEKRFPNVTGLELYNNGRAVNDNGDVFLTAVLDRNAQLDGQYITSVGLYDLGEEHMLAEYTLSNKARTMEYDGEEEEVTYESRLASYNLVTGQVDGELALPADNMEGETFSYSYRELNGKLLWNRQIDGEQLTATAYDSRLNQVATFTPPEGTDGYGYFSQDGSKYYTTQNGAILRYSTSGESDEGEKLTIQQSFSVSSLGELFAVGNTKYAKLSGVAGDLLVYDGVVNLNTGELVYLARESDTYLWVRQGVLTSQSYDDGKTSYLICTESGAYRYTWTGYDMVECQVLSNGDLLFCRGEYGEVEEGGTTMVLGLYDGETGTLISSTSLPVDMEYASPSSVVLSQTIENKMLLTIMDRDMNILFFTWEFGGANHEMDGMTVTEAELPAVQKPEIDDDWDPTSLKPGECPAELSDLRQRADDMEETYGVRIFISEECTNFLGGYVVMPESDYYTVEESLDVLEEQLAKYPAGFFDQFKGGWIDGIDIYLAGTLIGKGDDVLDYAGGFQLENEGHLMVVMDSTYPYSMTSSFHHEMSHAIESKIIYLSDTYIDGEEWAALNPDPAVYGDCYSYSYSTYSEFEESELSQFLYNLAEPENAYFMDNYSLTFPTEDRARIFEYAMDSDYSWIDWNQTPHLKAKLNYYAGCIRAAFDTTGWENVPWEAYLDS